MNCQKVGCEKPAKSYVYFEFRAYANCPPATGSPLLYLCDEHAVEIKWSDVMNDEVFQKIGDHFVSINKMRPVKEFSTLSIHPIKDEPENNNRPVS